MKIKPTAEDKLIEYYRYFSLSLTSLMYLLDKTGPSVIYKSLVIAILFLFAQTFLFFYRRLRSRPKTLVLAVSIEMVGIIALTLFTGGYESSFRLYVLNPVLIAAGSLSIYFGWSLLLSYISIFAVLCYFFINSANKTFLEIVFVNGNLFLTLVLTVIIMQIVNRMKRQREESNARTKETMEHIKSLYHIVETSSQHDFMNIGQVITDYVVKLTKLDKALFWFAKKSGEPAPQSRQTGWQQEEEQFLFSELGKHEHEWRLQREPIFRNLPGLGDFLLMPVRMSTRFVGMIGLKLESTEGLEGRRWYIQQLIFLSELSANILERHELGVIENRLIITNEQNRIADEMHDSVSQSLFGIVYATHSLKESWKRMSDHELEEQIELIHDSATKVAKELRITIYSLSSKKSGGPTWLGMVRSHLKSLSRLNDVDIELKITGDDFSLPYPYHKALFRIISEATGNAIRHGAASRVDVELSLKPTWIRLLICDNGVGFDTDLLWIESEDSASGLGMKNMQYLTQSLGGDFQLSSNENMGTRILISIPVGVAELKNA
ncbi:MULTISPECIES: sensor histidine kinase [Paenibacillus]|uniref:Oxygen sensor histidine kinase NreB n=1 Tax=Paenibacillus odorifer TaxID=189426 RepID=A0ABX3HRL5_9BACL|nr:ATP-binding protein [Paenibacillus odorifer]KAA1183335.1 two-component sensor histidine kinase [Paenibacillus sp. B2(2019)]OMD52716.1 two-component sensor histidine kinase [Paenibacillus odorifer]